MKQQAEDAKKEAEARAAKMKHEIEARVEGFVAHDLRLDVKSMAPMKTHFKFELVHFILG